MPLERRDYRFRLVLPAAQLLLCLCIIWPMRGLIASEVRASIETIRAEDPGSAQPPASAPPQIVLIPDPAFRPSRIAEVVIWMPAMLNLPAMMFELPQAILSPTHDSWRLPGMDPLIWRVIAWPVIGILFWWIAGRAVDALIAALDRLIRPSIGWAEVVLATATLAGGVIFCLLPFMVPDDRTGGPPMALVGIAGGVWSLLGAATIGAYVVQWRIQRQAAKQRKATCRQPPS